MTNLLTGDEQFDAFRQLAELTQNLNTEIAAYVLERFSTEYYMDDNSLAMSLSFAKKTLRELTGTDQQC